MRSQSTTTESALPGPGQRPRNTRLNRGAMIALPIRQSQQRVAGSAPYTPIRKAQPLHLRWLVDIATINQDGAAHALADAHHVERFELIPGCHNHKGISAFRRLIAR